MSPKCSCFYVKANQRDVTKIKGEKNWKELSSLVQAAGGSGSIYKEQQESGQQASNSGSKNQHMEA